MALSYLTDINLNKNELQNAVIQALPQDPDTGLEAGLIWFNSDDNYLKYYDGANIIPIGYVNFETDANNIKVAGTKSVGTLSTIPRADHIHPAQTTVSGNAGTATTLQTPRYIDGISFNGSANITHFATSSTPDATPDKSATTSTTGTNIFSLTTGAVVYVKFTYAATTKVAQVAQTLNVNQTGAKEIIIPKGYPNGGTLWGAGDTVGFVYDGAKWVAFGQYNTDTKNTAGSTDSSSKLFLVGATSQGTNPQTYSQDTAYVGTDGHLYSNSKQVVNLSDSQSVSNKTFTSSTYNGHSLAAAADKGVDTSISDGSSSTNLPTSAAVASFVSAQIGAADAMRFKGTLGTGGTVTDLPTTGVKIGDTYRVITATSGTYYTGLDKDVEVGDLVIATATTPTWTVAQTNIEGAITTADAADTNPIMDGTAAKGTSTKYARMDHVHPSDTSRVPTTRKVNGHALSADVTVTNLDLGQGYATCAIPSTAITGDTLSVTKSGYLLTIGGIVSIRFTGADLPLQSKLNINGKGAKPIYYNGQAINVADKVRENDTVTFIYDGAAYHLIAIDKANRNQKMFETIKVGSTNITPDSAIDTLEIVAGNGITLTPDATNDKITIASNNTNYTETNPALTQTGSLCTWTVTHNLGTQYNNVQIYRVSDGAQVMADIVATSTTVTTIKMISSANISAGTYRVVILGAA